MIPFVICIPQLKLNMKCFCKKEMRCHGASLRDPECGAANAHCGTWSPQQV